MRLFLLPEVGDQFVPLAAYLVENFVHFLDILAESGRYGEQILSQDREVGLLARAQLYDLLFLLRLDHDPLLVDHV